MNTLTLCTQLCPELQDHILYFVDQYYISLGLDLWTIKCRALNYEFNKLIKPIFFNDFNINDFTTNEMRFAYLLRKNRDTSLHIINRLYNHRDLTDQSTILTHNTARLERLYPCHMISNPKFGTSTGIYLPSNYI